MIDIRLESKLNIFLNFYLDSEPWVEYEYL